MNNFETIGDSSIKYFQSSSTSLEDNSIINDNGYLICSCDKQSDFTGIIGSFKLQMNKKYMVSFDINLGCDKVNIKINDDLGNILYDLKCLNNNHNDIKF
jgi:hypothetical protein